MAACAPGDILTTQQRHYPSQHLIISCGCVPVDPVARKIAILRDTAYHVVQLPKGRKNIAEDLLVATRATPVPGMADEPAPGQDPELTEGLLNCEPSSVSAYPCIYTGAFKIVFWFAAQGNFADVPVDGTKESWEEDVVLEWVDAREAAGMMSFKVDGDVIEKVLADMRNSGYDI
ncbi:hypothetical protein QQZ08_009560 [Neonectria magnoliae]|uniref:Nudix hydrolase domain-containing protein n=1 Tax=Neonectria magnoliae TaxID=2732573 RepID=A0ABR1HMA0_9HYPO